MSNNAFARLMAASRAAEEDEEQPPPAQAAPAPAQAAPAPAQAAPAPVTASLAPRAATEAPAAPRPRGRPATGKRSNPNYYGKYLQLHETVNVEVGRLLLRRDREFRDMSELVNHLLVAWLREQGVEVKIDDAGEQTT